MRFLFNKHNHYLFIFYQKNSMKKFIPLSLYPFIPSSLYPFIPLSLLLFFLLFFPFTFTLSAQQLINNKGNRNQSYPVVTETKPEIAETREKGQPEFDLLDSVRNEMVFANDQLAGILKGQEVIPTEDKQSNIPPDITHEEHPPEAPRADNVPGENFGDEKPEEPPPPDEPPFAPSEPPPPPRGGGLLGRISNLTGE